jgi:hypothetical protein
VGTSTSDSQFDSNVQITAAGGSTILLSRYSNNTAGPVLFLAKSRGSSIGTKTIVQSGDETGKIDFRATDGANHYSTARIEAFVDGTPGANDTPGRIVLSTTADGANTPTERFRITSAGNVGIGTASPSYKCDINVTGSALRLNSTTTQALLVISSDDAANAKIEFGDESDNDRGAITYDNPNNALIFQANAAERLRIANTGAFGLSGANYGTSGQVLTSNGSGSAPSWQDGGGGAEIFAWLNYASNGTFQAGVGFSSVTKGGGGHYTFNLSSSQPNDKYVAVGSNAAQSIHAAIPGTTTIGAIHVRRSDGAGVDHPGWIGAFR